MAGAAVERAQPLIFSVISIDFVSGQCLILGFYCFMASTLGNARNGVY